MTRLGPLALTLCVILLAPGASSRAATWSAAEPVPGGRTDFPFPIDVAMGVDGTSAVVWREDGALPALARGHVAVRERSGVPVPPRALGRPGVAGPVVAVDARGRVLVAWVQKRGGGSRYAIRAPYRVRLATRGVEGAWSTRTLGRAVRLIGGTPDIVAGEGGEVVVVWRGTRRVAGRRVEATVAAYRPPDGGFGRPVALRDEDGAGPRAQARVGIDGRGRASVAWIAQTTAGTRLWATRSDSAGRWPAAEALGETAPSAPSIDVSPRGDAAVAWRRGEGVAAALAADGLFGTPQPFDMQVRPLVAVSPSGATLLAWTPPLFAGPYAPELHFTLGEAATGFGPETVVPGVAATAVAVMGGGFALASADVGGVIAREMRTDGTLGDAHQVDTVGSSAALSAAGRRALLVWFRGDRLWQSVTAGG